MPVLPPPQTNQRTVLDLVTDAMIKIGALAPGETPTAEEAATGIGDLNLLIDTMNARKLFIYNVDFASYTLIPNHQPHTIGPGLQPNILPPVGIYDFTVPQRPTKIVAANLVLNNVSPPVNSPINLRDDAWWANQRVQGLTSTVPTDLYYSPSWDYGQLFLWPIPTFPYGIQLETWTSLVQFDQLADIVNLPPGYTAFLTYMLAVQFCASFDRQVPPAVAAMAAAATKAVQGLNSDSPRITLRGLGVGGERKGSSWNYLTGNLTGGSR